MDDENKVKIITRETFYVLLGITLFGAILRLYQLGTSSLWYDEAASILLTGYLDKCGSIFDARYFIEAPIMALSTDVWGWLINSVTDLPRISETKDFLYRLLPASSGIINIPLSFFAARRLLQKDSSALMVALLFAISPFHIYYAQELRIYSFLTTAGLLALISFHEAIVTNKLSYWIALALSFSLLLYCHFISFWYIVAFNIVYVLGYWWRYGRLLQWTAANATALLLSIPVLYLGLQTKAVIDQISLEWHAHATFKTGLITFKDFFYGYGPGSWAYWPLFILTAILFAAGLFSLRRNYPQAIVLLVLTVFPILANIVMWHNKDFSYYEHRTFIVSGVCAIIAVAAGLASVSSLKLRLSLLALVIALSVPALRNHYTNTLHPVEDHRIGIWEKVDFRSASGIVLGNWESGDLLTYANINPMFSVRYYLDAVPQTRVTVMPGEITDTYRALGSRDLADNYRIPPELLPDALGQSKRVWFINASGISFVWKDGAELALKWMRENLNEVNAWQLDGVELTLFEIPKM